MRINALSRTDGPGAFKVSVNDMLIKALAMALRNVRVERRNTGLRERLAVGSRILNF